MEDREGMPQPDFWSLLAIGARGGVVAVMLALALIAIRPCGLQAAATGDSQQPAAMIGRHPISQEEVDARVLQDIPKNQLYNMRKQALDQMIDQFVVEKAAKKAKLTPMAYLKTELKTTPVTEADARKYYDAHKSSIDAQTNNRPFDQIKVPLMNALQRRQDGEEREALLDKLRDENNVKVLLAAPRTAIASAGHPWTGGKDATVTIVEFSDFQCPYCRAAEPTVKAVRDKYGDKVKFVYMDFPLGMHQHAMDAANAAQCASDQNKFWQYHDALFADQSKLDVANLKATAAKAGLDTKQFDTCFDSKTKVPGIQAEQAEGSAAGVSATPTFFVNGREIEGAESLPVFQNTIDDELAAASHPSSKTAQNGAKSVSDEPQAKAD
jgi:protein-disulfide isomerase